MGLLAFLKTQFVVHLLIGFVFVVSGLVINAIQLCTLVLWPLNKQLYRRLNCRLAYSLWSREYRARGGAGRGWRHLCGMTRPPVHRSRQAGHLGGGTWTTTTTTQGGARSFTPRTSRRAGRPRAERCLRWDHGTSQHLAVQTQRAAVSLVSRGPGDLRTNDNSLSSSLSRRSRCQHAAGLVSPRPRVTPAPEPSEATPG